MKTYTTAFRALLGRPVVQDVGLAGLLFVSTSVLMESLGGTPILAGAPKPLAELATAGIWWFLTSACVASVLGRRRWPVAMLAVAMVATVLQMAVAAGPNPANLAVPIALYTVASRRPRRESLGILCATLVTAMAWSVYVASDGKIDGWLFSQPLEIRAGKAAPKGDLPFPPPPPMPTIGLSSQLGPTDWGGFPILGSVLTAAWAVGSSVRSRRAYLDELRARARDLERERDQQAALATAAERGRITRELHDVVAHGLSVIVMQAQGGMAAFANRPADTLAALNTIVDTGRASLADMRQVLAVDGEVDSSPHPVPGLGRLPQLVEQVRQAGTPVLLQVDGSPGVLPTSVDVSAYRIVQEALTNTMKHAGPGACAQVIVAYGTNDLKLDVSDNGTARPTADGVGNGLRGMRERVALLRGEFFAGPGPRGGFVVRARLPIQQELVA